MLINESWNGSQQIIGTHLKDVDQNETKYLNYMQVVTKQGEWNYTMI